MNYQPTTGRPCGCKAGRQRDNCTRCEGTGQEIDFAAVRALPLSPRTHRKILEEAGWTPVKVRERMAGCYANRREFRKINTPAQRTYRVLNVMLYRRNREMLAILTG